jgi:hypothetical protein
MAMDVEAEIRDRKRRVSELEGSFGFLTRQIKGVHKDLLTFQSARSWTLHLTDTLSDRPPGCYTFTRMRLHNQDA